jgi:hypothetical protein
MSKYRVMTPFTLHIKNYAPTTALFLHIQVMSPTAVLSPHETINTACDLFKLALWSTVRENNSLSAGITL